MARISVDGQTLEAASGETIEAAVSRSGRHPDSYIFLIGGRPVPMDTVPPEDSEVRAMRVASGG